jgi:RNA polymerase sigma-70 factor (ECF subfamily)
MNRVMSGCEHEAPKESEWGEWLAHYAPRFLLFARQQARCEADAQDLAQEAIVASWQRGPDGAPPLPALVFATIRRRAIDKARSADRRSRRESDAILDTAQVWFDGEVESREQGQILQEAMNRLPKIYRDVVTLKVWGELTFAEIAVTLEIPANTAASRYRYGLIELRKWTKDIFP